MTETGKRPNVAEPIDLTPVSDPRLPGLLTDIVATHHPKLGHSKVDAQQFVRRKGTANRRPEFEHGICSLAIGSPYGFGTTSSGQDIAVATALSCDLGETTPMSVLGALNLRAKVAGVDQPIWDGLQKAFDELDDHAPSQVTQWERLVFFEDGTEEILVTPIVSLKVLHEMNRRLKDRREAYFDAKANGETPSERLIPRVDFRVGGANPQNVGYAVNKGTRNTTRGSIPLVSIRCPEERRSENGRALSVMGAAGSYARIAEMDPADLMEYGRRSAMHIELGTHRRAEVRQAREIADQFVAMHKKLATSIAAMDRLDMIEPWKNMNIDELGWLDPRVGSFDRAALAERFGYEVKSRIERMLNAGKDAEAARFVLSDRSTSNLIAAFEESVA